MEAANLKLYVRGFFGSMSMSSETYQQNRSKPILSVFDLNPEALKHVVCNESVVEVYNQMIRRQVIHTNFDFRERCIKIALNAFGVHNFAAWILLNKASPTFTQSHADFLMDTVRFIVSGKRHTSVDSWERLIAPGSNDPVTPVVFDNDLLGALPSERVGVNRAEISDNLHLVIAMWLSHPGGFADLITTLYTLFGEHNTR